MKACCHYWRQYCLIEVYKDESDNLIVFFVFLRWVFVGGLLSFLAGFEKEKCYLGCLADFKKNIGLKCGSDNHRCNKTHWLLLLPACMVLWAFGYPSLAVVCIRKSSKVWFFGIQIVDEADTVLARRFVEIVAYMVFYSGNCFVFGSCIPVVDYMVGIVQWLDLGISVGLEFDLWALELLVRCF